MSKEGVSAKAEGRSRRYEQVRHILEVPHAVDEMGGPALPGGGGWKKAEKILNKKPWKRGDPRPEPPDPAGHYIVGAGLLFGAWLALAFLPTFLATISVFLIGAASARILAGLWATNDDPFGAFMRVPGFVLISGSGGLMTGVLQAALAGMSPLVFIGSLALGLFAGTLRFVH